MASEPKARKRVASGRGDPGAVPPAPLKPRNRGGEAVVGEPGRAAAADPTTSGDADADRGSASGTVGGEGPAREFAREGVGGTATPRTPEAPGASGVTEAPGAPRAIGIFITHLRERAGMSQAALARATGLSQSAISLIEAGSNPRADTLLAVARALGVNIAALFGEPLETLASEDALFYRNFTALAEAAREDVREYVLFRLLRQRGIRLPSGGVRPSGRMLVRVPSESPAESPAEAPADHAPVGAPHDPQRAPVAPAEQTSAEQAAAPRARAGRRPRR